MPLQQIRVTPAEETTTDVQENTESHDVQQPPQPEQLQSPQEQLYQQLQLPEEPQQLRDDDDDSPESPGQQDECVCRICHCEAEPQLPLIAPCWCAGSLRYVHQACLQQWIKSSDTRCCELCNYHFVMHTAVKPFNKWEKLEMSPVERRKVLCSVAFHVVAVTCVVWSLYVLIDRTAEEMRSGVLNVLEWPFWTKLIVVAIGFTGGLVFMYVQCKMYVQLFRRWRAFNRIIYVQNAPPDDHGQPLPPQVTVHKTQQQQHPS